MSLCLLLPGLPHDVPLLQAKAEQHVREAASQGANIILLQELFGTCSSVALCNAPCRCDIARHLHLGVHKLDVHAAAAETPYFCQEQVSKHFKLAAPLEGNPLIARCGQA
jgi:hypothetical protein